MFFAEIGCALFAIQSSFFPCEEVRSCENRPISYLYGTFGTNNQCLDSLNPSKRMVYLTNESCRRLHRCGPGEFMPQLSVDGYNRAIANRDLKIKIKIRRRAKKANADILVLGLESRFSNSAARNLAIWLKRYDLAINPVPDSNNYFRPKYVKYLELHTEAPRGDIYTNDGFRAEPSAFVGRGLSFVWEGKCQGVSRDFVSPRRRRLDCSGFRPLLTRILQRLGL